MTVVTNQPTLPSWIKQVQGASALAFTTFLVPHLINTVLGIGGESTYNSFQTVVRGFYHSRVGEALVLSSLGLHLASSAYIVYQRRRVQSAQTQQALHKKSDDDVANRDNINITTKAVPSALQAHRYAGYILLSFIGGHVYYCRFFGPAPEFGGLSYLTRFGLTRHVFFGYLVLFAAAGVVHLLIGVPTAARQIGLPGKQIRKWTSLMIKPTFIVVAVLATTLGVLGIRGAFRALPDYSQHPYVIAHNAAMH